MATGAGSRLEANTKEKFIEIVRDLPAQREEAVYAGFAYP